MFIDKSEISISGKVFRVARLRHEWCEFLDEPVEWIEKMKRQKPGADLFTFLQEAHLPRPQLSFHHETVGASVVTIKSFDDWWKELHFKARNKARKAHKTGVEIHETELNDQFVRGVEKMYNECPIRQGRKFTHYGEKFEAIKKDLGSFPGKTVFTGAYLNGELIGFMKLFEGTGILRIIHILAMLEHRDKCVMDALIAHAVKICDEKNISHLHYGDWTSRGLGAFRVKYNFQRHDCIRYFVPLTTRGKFMLNLRLHRPLRERLPQSWVDRLIGVRNHWNSLRYGMAGNAVET
jgi:hypothetical protein